MLSELHIQIVGHFFVEDLPHIEDDETLSSSLQGHQVELLESFPVR